MNLEEQGSSRPLRPLHEQKRNVSRLKQGGNNFSRLLGIVEVKFHALWPTVSLKQTFTLNHTKPP